MNVTELNRHALEVLDELLMKYDALGNEETDYRQASILANIGQHIIMTMDYIKQHNNESNI